MPSKLNPADPVSRQDDTLAKEAGWKKVEVVLPKPQEFWWVEECLQQFRARQEKAKAAQPKPKAKPKVKPPKKTLMGKANST